MITFFTSLKALSGITAIQQRNALRSWRASVPDCEIIVFGTLADGDDLFAEVGVTYCPEIACNEYSTPLISAMFSEAQRLGRHAIVCYINGDIILLPDFSAAMTRLATWKAFCAVGQRWDIDWVEPIDFAKRGWDENLRAMLEVRGQQHDHWAMDVFAFRRGAIGPLPEFAIGRPAWDNYLIKYLSKCRIPIVDMSAAVKLIHQNHDYTHVAKRKGVAWEGPEADRNRGLAAQAFGRFNPRYYSIANAPWLMSRGWIVPALSPRRVLLRFLARTVPDGGRDTVNNYLYSLQYLSRSLPKLSRFWDLYVSSVPFALLPRKRCTIAVVRVDNIGDFVLWLDGARAIRVRYPRSEYRVTLIASAKWSSFAEASNLFDEVITIDRGRFFAEPRFRRATCRSIAKRRFETVINPTFSRDTWIDDFLVMATGASIRVGQTGDLDNQPSRFVKKLTDSWYTQLLSEAEHATHELEKNWHFARQFDANITLRIPGLELAMVSRPAWLPVGHKYFLLFPGAQRAIRKWPVERFAEIARRIHAKTGWSAVICGLASDADAAKGLVAQAPGVPILDACGRTTLQEFAGVIAEAGLVVTNDSSTVHLAAALDRPAVVILGGGHFGRFLPYPEAAGAASRNIHAVYHSMTCYHCSWHCIYPLQPDDPAVCVTAVTVEDVWSTVKSMLELKCGAAVQRVIPETLA